MIELSRTPYFNRELETYLKKLIVLIELFIENYDSIHKAASGSIAKAIWAGSKFFTGSTSKRIPYEIVYALKLALKEWTDENCVITTALLEEQEYYFNSVEPAHVISKFIPGIDFDVKLIQIALPKLYRHKPIYNVALYHELGHYIDEHYKISKLCFLIYSKTNKNFNYKHLGEYFADLFAANYTGYGISKFLNCIAENAPNSESHPSTESRLKVVDDFINGNANKYVELFNEILTRMALPILKIRYRKPDITKKFDRIQPYTIESNAEVHGIIESAWEYLENTQKNNIEIWNNIDEFEIHRIINDLVEKSIRNKIVREKWENGNS